MLIWNLPRGAFCKYNKGIEGDVVRLTGDMRASLKHVIYPVTTKLNVNISDIEITIY